MNGRVTIYAGSHSGTDHEFEKAVDRFVRDLVGHGMGIVYGGGRVGLMGTVANAALCEGGEVTGVIPRSLTDAEITHPYLTQLHVVDSMHERKHLMADLGDVFVAVPGGVGTVEELFEVWAWLILGFHQKPVTLLNINGYWDPLLSMIRVMTRSGFLSEKEEASIRPIENAAELVRLLGGWRPPPPRW
ncbi:TIGR00730 family Rossman fold protein [Streptomyces angustmyceticus]|uniref:Cytokinin riboside 5'-monophosphate phosphoribohydrolase n=1 Tax=Streptomyces angustmyceticus TaxID=285578 RepID=A0A5J4LQC3_9ACTN|nr:TIGR00730 family Rossman fold protein [Streptomyces angustmyceticus]UAL71000.1 TIGR00730 family Rossman fold protein [Streptomyces angustmyceticus]GES32575.1 cytokinin riboside 5'-monophosphate phosphoribohydrolase [Streptomyces angustmyceticus]